jgi:hypothetical protein
MFASYQIVRLTRDIPESSLSAGMIDTIVTVYDTDPPGYEVEFVDARPGWRLGRHASR